MRPAALLRVCASDCLLQLARRGWRRAPARGALPQHAAAAGNSLSRWVLLALPCARTRSINEKATTIQRVYRGHVGRKHARALRAMQVRLATHAQRIWRAKVARRKLAEIRERRIVNWAAARMQSVFRGKRQRVIMRLWKGRRWMAAASMQTAWRLYRAQTRRLDKQDDDLTTWMLALLDLGYSRDPIKPGVELRLAHKRALLKRLRGDMREAEDGEGKDDADALPAGGVTKTVLASKEDVRAQIRALNQVPAGVMDPRKARRPVVTTAKVWSMASRNRKKTKIASGALRGRAAMIAAAGGGKDAAAGARGSVYMGPPPVVAKPRILIHIPAAMAERIAEGRAEADRIQRELDEEELEAMGEQGGADGGGADGVAPQGGGGGGGGGPAAKAQRPGILKRAAAAAKAAARNIGGAEAAAALAPGPAASGDDPAWHPLEAPPGARFDRRDKYGQPSLQEVMDDMRRMSDALQWHMERIVREQRRKAAYAIRSAESKAQHVALRARETALRSEAAVETTRRLRSFVAGVTEIQAELRAREAGLRAHAEEQERQMRRARAQVRKADRAARDDLRRAGGLLDAAELGRILAMLPSVEAIRATTAASRASVGEWEREAPESRMTRRQRRLSQAAPGGGDGGLGSALPDAGARRGGVAPGGFEGLFATRSALSPGHGDSFWSAGGLLAGNSSAGFPTPRSGSGAMPATPDGDQSRSGSPARRVRTPSARPGVLSPARPATAASEDAGDSGEDVVPWEDNEELGQPRAARQRDFAQDPQRVRVSPAVLARAQTRSPTLRRAGAAASRGGSDGRGAPSLLPGLPAEVALDGEDGIGPLPVPRSQSWMRRPASHAGPPGGTRPSSMDGARAAQPSLRVRWPAASSSGSRARPGTAAGEESPSRGILVRSPSRAKSPASVSFRLPDEQEGEERPQTVA